MAVWNGYIVEVCEGFRRFNGIPVRVKRRPAFFPSARIESSLWAVEQLRERVR